MGLLHPLPLLDHVISTRFFLYGMLAMSIALAMWLTDRSGSRRLKWAARLGPLPW